MDSTTMSAFRDEVVLIVEDEFEKDAGISFMAGKAVGGMKALPGTVARGAGKAIGGVKSTAVSAGKGLQSQARIMGQEFKAGLGNPKAMKAMKARQVATTPAPVAPPAPAGSWTDKLPGFLKNKKVQVGMGVGAAGLGGAGLGYAAGRSGQQQQQPRMV